MAPLNGGSAYGSKLAIKDLPKSYEVPNFTKEFSEMPKLVRCDGFGLYALHFKREELLGQFVLEGRPLEPKLLTLHNVMECIALFHENGLDRKSKSVNTFLEEIFSASFENVYGKDTPPKKGAYRADSFASINERYA